MNKYHGLDEKVILMVHVYARKLFNKRVLRSMDVEDIEQELMLEAFQSLKDYNEYLGNKKNFLETVIQNSAKELLMRNFRLKRGGKIIFEEFIPDVHSDIAALHNVDDLIKIIDFSRVIDYLPIEKRILCMLARRHSIPEISKILGINRATLYSKFRVITRMIRNIYYSQNSFCSDKSLTTLESYMKNISILETLSAKEISVLDTADLMDLTDQVTNLNSQVKEMKQKLDDGLNLRFSETVKSNLQGSGKDTGTARFFDGTYQIIAEIPKKVTWDAEKMEEIIKKISKEKKEDLIKITYSVDERKYLSLPPEWQSVFKEARTVTPGKARYQITIGDPS